MAVHTIYAQIYKSEVKNLVVGEYYFCDIAAKESYGNEAFAVDATQIPVAIGDIYESGSFYRMVNGKKRKIEPVPTDDSKINSALAEVESTSSLLEEVATLLLELAEATE